MESPRVPSPTLLTIPLFLLVVSLTSCATTWHEEEQVPLRRLIQERPMTGAHAAEPMPNAVAHITSRTSATHMGTDFTANKKAVPVYVVKEGVVVSNTETASSSAAMTITVLNTDGSVSRYLHIGSPVAPGTGLSIGEPLGLVLLPGQKGYGATNTGPHLHYEQYRSEQLFKARTFMTTDEVVAQWTN